MGSITQNSRNWSRVGANQQPDVFVMGVMGWLRPGDRPAALPPITALAFVVAIMPPALRLIRNRDGA